MYTPILRSGRQSACLHARCCASWVSPRTRWRPFFFFKQKTAYEIGLGIPAEPLFRSVWIATDRSRARRCVEACVYGTLDFVGYPRFPAPVEFIAAVIAYYVHPVNIQTACLIMEGAEFT